MLTYSLIVGRQEREREAKPVGFVVHNMNRRGGVVHWLFSLEFEVRMK